MMDAYNKEHDDCRIIIYMLKQKRANYKDAQQQITGTL